MDKLPSYWPHINVDDTRLKAVLEQNGYHFLKKAMSRTEVYLFIVPSKDYTLSQINNGYIREQMLTDGIISFEELEKIENIIATTNQEILEEKRLGFPEKFASLSLDQHQLFAVIPESPRAYADPKKYEYIDSEKGHSNYLYVNMEKLKEFKENNLTIDFSKKLYTNSYGSNFIGNYEFGVFSKRYGINFKIQTDENHATYIIDGNVMENLGNRNYDLSDPIQVAEAKHLGNLRWPNINGAETHLANLLKEKGFQIERIGRSGFEVRNSYAISTADGILNDESLALVQKAISAALGNEKQEQEDTFIKNFNTNSPDSGKTYAVVPTGGEYDREISVPKGFDKIADIRTACTADHRQKISHTYDSLYISSEAMKKDPRRVITLIVPKDMIGSVIGKGGSIIKALGLKYGKHFKVEQSSQEISQLKAKELRNEFSNLVYSSNSEKVLGKVDISLASYPELNNKDREELSAYFKSQIAASEVREQKLKEEKHQQELNSIEKNIKQSFGEEFIRTNDKALKEGIDQYLINNLETLPTVPTDEELAYISENIKRSRNSLRLSHKAEQERKIEHISSSIQDFIQNQERGSEKMVSAIELEQHIRENHANTPFTEGFIEGETTHLERRQQEAALKIQAYKNFDTIAAQEYSKFYNNYEDSGSHGDGYFSCVGKDRRAFGYTQIAYRTGKRLGVLSESFEDAIQYDNPEYKEFTKVCNKIIDFEMPANYENTNPNQQCQDYDLDASNQEPIELTPAQKEAEKEKLRLAKKNAGKEMPKGKSIKGGLDGLASLLGGYEK